MKVTVIISALFMLFPCIELIIKQSATIEIMLLSIFFMLWAIAEKD